MEDCQDIYQQILGRVSVMGISLFQGQSHLLFTDIYFQYMLCTVTHTHDTHYCGDCGWIGLRALVLIATSKEPLHMCTCKITKRDSDLQSSFCWEDVSFLGSYFIRLITKPNVVTNSTLNVV